MGSGSVGGRFVEFAQDAYFSSIGRWTLKQADYVISFTQKEKTISPDRAVVIPNGVDTQLFRPDPQSKSMPQSVIWTGRYVAEKRLKYLLEAAKIVTEEFPRSKFVLVGYGEELSMLKDLRRKLGLDENVVFLGPRPQGQIVNLLNQCTLFALPSLSEGFPSSVLEAMSCAKPVVVSSGIGLEEVVGEAGLYAAPGDADALAKSISAILRDRKLAISLGRRGRERVLGLYDWQKVVNAVDGLFERAIQQRSA